MIRSRLANSITFNNENIVRGQQQQQPPPAAIINIESDDSDHDVTFLETVQKSSVPTLQSQPPAPRPTRPPECLVQTKSGPLDYHENCLCVKCRKIKACLAKWDDECDCEDCQPDCTGAGDQRQQKKQQPKATNPSMHQHSRVPPQRSHHNNPQQQQPKVLPSNDDDNRNSKCSTPYYMSQFFGNDHFNDDAQGDHSEGDAEETNQTEPTSSSTTATTNKKQKKVMMKNNKKASTSRSQCPRCQVIISSTARMATHYRVMHLAWRPYYCKWTKCAFTSGHSALVRNHIKSKHLNTTETSALKHVKQYVGKRAENDPNDEQLPTDGVLSEHLLASTGTHWPVTRSTTSGPTTFECPKCGRKFAYQLYLDAHLVSHGHSGVRCTWANNCGHFYSITKLKDAKQHVCTDHLAISAVDITRKDRKDAKQHLEHVTSGNDNFSFVACSSSSSATAKLTTSIVPASQNDADQQPTAEPINMPQFDCPQCPTSCRTMARLIDHLLLMHTTKKKPFVCFRCTYSSYCEASVAEHFHTVHNGTNLFWCKLPNCANAYFALEQIEAHLRAKHASALAGMDISGREWNKVIDMFVLKR